MKQPDYCKMGQFCCDKSESESGRKMQSKERAVVVLQSKASVCSSAILLAHSQFPKKPRAEPLKQATGIVLARDQVCA